MGTFCASSKLVKTWSFLTVQQSQVPGNHPQTYHSPGILQQWIILPWIKPSHCSPWAESHWWHAETTSEWPPGLLVGIDGLFLDLCLGRWDQGCTWHNPKPHTGQNRVNNEKNQQIEPQQLKKQTQTQMFFQISCLISFCSFIYL